MIVRPRTPLGCRNRIHPRVSDHSLPHRVHMIRLAVLLLAAAAGSLVVPNPAMAQWARIIEIKHVTPAKDSTAATGVADTRHVWVFPGGDDAERAEAFHNREFEHRDRLGLVIPWATKLGLSVRERGRTKERQAVVARAFLDSDGNKVLRGSAEHPDGALYAFERSGDQTQVEILSGAMVLRDWKGGDGETVCIRATSACARTEGTRFAIEVDDDRRSRMAVDEGDVEIDWRHARDSDSTVVVMARARSVWTWTETDPPVEEDTDDALFGVISDALEHYGDDVWGKSFFETPWPYITVGGAVLVCILTDIWFCGGDGDATGTVTVSP